MNHPVEQFMKAAIQEAFKAKEAGDYAIGAVVIKNDQIITRSSKLFLIKDFMRSECLKLFHSQYEKQPMQD